MIVFVAIVMIALLGIFHMYKEATTNTLIEQTISFSDFPETFGKMRIFFISDVHKRRISPKLVKRAKGKADLVIIGGDLAEKGVALQQISHNIQLLQEIGPVYFVWGNNDYEINFRDLDALLLQHKVTILDNTRVVLESDVGEKIVLLGVDDVGVGRDRLDLALQDCQEEGFRILVSHNPSIIKKFIGTEDIRLVLSGHTHGGQIRIGGAAVSGLYHKEHTTLFVSNGYGTTLVPFRFRAPSQTHIITLQRE